MSKQWVEIFDKAAAGERGKDIRIDEIAANYNPSYSPAPATLGHTSSYKPDTRIPVGNWVEELKAVGTKLLATFKEPGKIKVQVPAMFQELAKMPEFFKEAVNKKLYSKRSIGVIEKDGKQQLHHVAFLGAALPECKGMPDVVFNEHPDFKLLTADFTSADDTIIEFTQEEQPEVPMTKLLSIFKEFASLGQDRMKIFADIDVTKLTEEEISALTDMIPLLKSILGLNESASIMELLGALKVREADFKRLQEALAAIGTVATTPGSAVSSFMELTELVEKLQKPIEQPPMPPTGSLTELAAIMAPVMTQLGELNARMKKFEEVAPPPPSGAAPAPAAGAPAAELKVETLGKSDEDCQKDAEAAKQQIMDKKSWIPAYDESLMPVMKILANVKLGEGSALDSVVSALTSVEGIAEMNEHFTQISKMINVEEFIEARKPVDPLTHLRSHVALRKNETLQNGDVYQKVVEYQTTNKLKTYVEASNEMKKKNLL